jgi:hypothetical protein
LVSALVTVSLVASAATAAAQPDAPAAASSSKAGPVAAPPSGSDAEKPEAGESPPVTDAASGDKDKPAAARGSATGGDVMQAYQAALVAQKLGVNTPLSQDSLAHALADAEDKLQAGRRDEAVSDLVYLVESPRFKPFANLDGGRAAVFLLGDALGRSGAREPARAYLGTLLVQSPPDVWARRAARSLVDFGLESDKPEPFVAALSTLSSGVPEELAGDIAYLSGRTKQRSGKDDEALGEFAKVTKRSRFWAQATYLSGLIHVRRGHLKSGEGEFCKIADVKKTPREALVFGGGDFFEVRDLARLGLGRIAHEEYRFDDSRYYYYLVPTDSAHLPEALYESANSRYEAKDYRGARDLLDQMWAGGAPSPYEDEAWVFDAYVDLSLCEFPRADEKLRSFLKRYEPVRNAARDVAKDDAATKDLVEAVVAGKDPASLGGKHDPEAWRALGASLRKDPDYTRAARRLAELDYQVSGLRQTMAALDDAKVRASSPAEVRPRAEGGIRGTAAERTERIDAQLGEVRRLLSKVKASGANAAEVQALETQLAALESRTREAVRVERPPMLAEGGQSTIPELVEKDRSRATALHVDSDAMRNELVTAERKAARDALGRYDQRLSRLLRRARLGRIETVLGKKRSLEVEIEALSEGILPQGAVDSLDAARYLRDDEEYWPYEGEDWADEYVGGEGLE